MATGVRTIATAGAGGLGTAPPVAAAPEATAVSQTLRWTTYRRLGGNGGVIVLQGGRGGRGGNATLVGNDTDGQPRFSNAIAGTAAPAAPAGGRR